MLVSDLMSLRPKEIISVDKETSILKAMHILIENKISCLPITDDYGKLEGIISDKDIFKAVFKNQEDFVVYKVGDLMTTDLIVGVKCDELDYIAGVMTQNRVRHIPIVEHDKLIWLVSIGDIVQTQLKHVQIENRYLRQYIEGSYPC